MEFIETHEDLLKVTKNDSEKKVDQEEVKKSDKQVLENLTTVIKGENYPGKVVKRIVSDKENLVEKKFRKNVRSCYCY